MEGFAGPDLSGFGQNVVDTLTRQWDLEYGLKKQGLDQQYAIAKMNAKTAADRAKADAWYQKAQIGLAKERLAQDKYEFEQNIGLKRAELGYNLLGQAAQLRGPENYVQAANFARGVANSPYTPQAFGALLNNTTLPDFGYQAGISNPETIQTLMNKLQGGGTQGSPNTITGGSPTSITGQGDGGSGQNSMNAFLDPVKALALAGAHKIAPGGLEQLTGTEQKLLGSGLDAIGVDTPTFLEQYRRSRIGQGFAATGA